MTDIKVKCSACGHFTRISGTEQNRAYEQGRLDERPKAFANGYESGYKQGRADAIDKIYRYVKMNCNPYGKPSLDYESGVKILNYLEQLKEQNK